MAKQIASGMPDPNALIRYNDAVPDGAARIFAAFEAESAHRRKLEELAQAAQIADTKRGQLFGLIIGLAALAVGGLTASVGNSPVAGTFIGSGGVIGLVSVFVLGRTLKK